MKPFEDFWAHLLTHLTVGTEVNNWTALKGFVGDKMTVVKIGDASISVDTPRTKGYQRVPKQDFEKVFAVWSDYKINKIPRNELTDLTRYSKYIISLLRWYEDNVPKY